MKVLDSRREEPEEFSPLHGNKVYMYVCGPTTYDYSHIGHARTYVAYDVIARYLRYKGYTVFFLMNITDVDDKIIERAAEEGVAPLQLARRFEGYFMEDLRALGITSINYFARASEYMSEIIHLIEALLEKGYAYETSSGVFYNVERFQHYGELSRRRLEELKVHRVEPDPTKRHPVDFALWKKRDTSEFGWDSPWGYGRPGWHVEDVAIILSHVGAQLDIHGGAIELVFPHHEAEVALAEAATGVRPFSKYWLHTGLLTVSGVKMSKSLGNFITIRDALQRVDAETLRLYFLMSHYRSPIDFSWQKLGQAEASLRYLYGALEQLAGAPEADKASGGEVEILTTVAKLRSCFLAAMDNDFNTPEALARLFEMAREVSRLISAQHSVSSETKRQVLSTFRELGGILGILQKEVERPTKTPVNDLVQLIVEVRSELRRNKQYELADRIREGLGRLGIILEDTDTGTKWRQARI
ncbi:Cysteine--tRNA ligase [Candidatus Calditenuaceae archaeon HR02]|nr:Cysteine--tRNA ligase [Candidatus Calditenuaceae archaeon HR02]